MKYIKIILTVIAILLGMINYKLWTWQNISTRGDFIALREAKTPDARMRFLKNIPIIWVQGGDIDANIVSTPLR